MFNWIKNKVKKFIIKTVTESIYQGGQVRVAIKILDTGVLGEVRGLKANRINTNWDGLIILKSVYVWIKK